MFLDTASLVIFLSTVAETAKWGDIAAPFNAEKRERKKASVIEISVAVVDDVDDDEVSPANNV